MVRKSDCSPRENNYYNQINKDDDDDFTIMTSDFAAKAVGTNTSSDASSAKAVDADKPSDATSLSKAAATAKAEKEYEAFVSGLDDRQKNAIRVLDKWFQLKQSSCANQMTATEAGNANAANLSEKELGMKLGIGAASISYSGGNGKAIDVEAEEKITSLESELVEVRKELDRERSKGKNLKEVSSTAIKEHQNEIESLKSKLKYYKKENEALNNKVLLYKEALEETDNHDADADALLAPSVDSSVETAPASNTENAEVTTNDKEQSRQKSPMRYDRSMLRKKMNSTISPIKASGRDNKQELKKDVEDVAIEKREMSEADTFSPFDIAEEKREAAEDTEDADLTFSDLLAANHPAATAAPTMRPKFKVSSSGAFGSAPASATPEAKDADAVEDTKGDYEQEDGAIDKEEPKPSAFSTAMKNFSNGSAKKEEEAVSSEEAKEEGEKSEEPEGQPTVCSTPKSKIAGLTECYGSSVRSKRMSFESPQTTAPTSWIKEPAPVPVKEDTLPDIAPFDEETAATDNEAASEIETAEVTDDVAEVSTPSKASAPVVAASSNVGPASAQKELEALRSMLKGRGVMANKKMFEG